MQLSPSSRNRLEKLIFNQTDRKFTIFNVTGNPVSLSQEKAAALYPERYAYSH